MGWIKGFEPSTSRATIWRANQLRYIHHVLARLKGLEPLALCLEGRCSIQLSYRRIYKKRGGNVMERVMGIEPTRPAWKAGVLPLNYTRVCKDSVTARIIIPYKRVIVKSYFHVFSDNLSGFYFYPSSVTNSVKSRRFLSRRASPSAA